MKKAFRMDSLKIRPICDTDGEIAASIFFDAVHAGTREYYTHEQREAWGGTAPDPAAWDDRLRGMDGFVAELDGSPVGFMTIDRGGYIDLAFVMPSVAGTGVGWQLYGAVERSAREFGATRLTTQASRKARPFFERQGWTVEREQTAVRRGVELTNFRMWKQLTSEA
jgi:putative acetyltransferase